MYWLAYRNNGSYQSLVVAHTVDTGGDHAGVRWYELRKTGSNPWTVNQASTFNPDTTHRWMPSAAMDGNQNIAVGYSASSATLFPGYPIRGPPPHRSGEHAADGGDDVRGRRFPAHRPLLRGWVEPVG